ncbi:chemotaxis response regulator protein-glutamate methylesterase [Oceaniserpentilla sp. 4NH20-0058]|uniref:protein-glutamate methylesterase/protein-glutamine glutaminase n=1 Tax=Oceaniserpentilla sp. 4NH20-0058 TaxID=3127660 RepID=UPI0031062038
MIKVLIVDDSILIRKVLTEVFSKQSDIEVVGTAADPLIAREKIKTLNPDVITLDIEMPKMDGITFLRNLMRLRPMPVVMISTLTQKGAPSTLEALELGAVDYIGKPSADKPELLAEYAEEIVEKVRMASVANINRLELQANRPPVKSLKPVPKQGLKRDGFIIIGASTGGTEAIRELLCMMPVDTPPIVITQHIPPVFSASFAKRIDNLIPQTVSEAQDGDKILAGHIYIAPGDRHFEVVQKGAHYYCSVYDGERVNLHKPSVEVLFDSIVKLPQLAKSSIGIMLTGMGADGADAMLRLKQTGCYNIIQDKDSSVVWGMPGAAAELGAGDSILPLHTIAGHIVNRLKK